MKARDRVVWFPNRCEQPVVSAAITSLVHQSFCSDGSSREGRRHEVKTAGSIPLYPPSAPPRRYVMIYKGSALVIRPLRRQYTAIYIEAHITAMSLPLSNYARDALIMWKLCELANRIRFDLVIVERQTRTHAVALLIKLQPDSCPGRPKCRFYPSATVPRACELHEVLVFDA